MEIKINTFAGLKELIGKEIILSIAKPISINEIRKKLVELYPKTENILSISAFIISDSIVSLDYTLSENSELLIFPPVSGG